MSKDTSDTSVAEEAKQFQYKIIILGDGAVGKTSLAMRHTDDAFSANYKQTIGLDFYLKRLILPSDAQVTLQIWDIGGQSIGGKMLKNYIFGAQAVLLVYDITSYESFQNLEDWYQLVIRTFGLDKLPYVALIANKLDLNHIRAVTESHHKQFADENSFHSFQVSAKTGDRVNATFRDIAADLAGIALSKTDMDAEAPILKAQIINHERDDPDVKCHDIRSKERGCMLQ